jgi:lipopolysaccharide transport system permease protein
LFGILPLLVVITVWTHALPWTIVFLPLVVAVQLVFTAGLAYAVASLTVFVRDIPQALGPLILLGFYATPIVYSDDMVPRLIRPLERLNPMAAVAQGYRDTLFGGTIHPVALGWSFLVSALIAIAGFALFRRTRGAFADVL